MEQNRHQRKCPVCRKVVFLSQAGKDQIWLCRCGWRQQIEERRSEENQKNLTEKK